MPIYEFTCAKCRVVFSFLSKRINPDRIPVCPKCGNKKMLKEMSGFAAIKGGRPSEEAGPGGAEEPMPDMDDPRLLRAMNHLEQDMAHMDENNPRHMAHMMKKMKELMPTDALPKELDIAIKRLDSGEDPEKIEEDMGDVLGDMMEDPKSRGFGGSKGGTSAFGKDPGLYDY